MEFFDSHSHYNDEAYNEDREEILKAIYNDGITKTVINSYEKGEKVVEENGTSYEIMNKTVDYQKSGINIKVVEVDNTGDVEKELDEYYNFYNSDKIQIEKIEENYISLKFVSGKRYKCLIGVDKYLVYVNTLKGNKNEETYNMLIDFINYKYPLQTKK